MWGVKSDDLVAIIDFLYFGEANVYQENLDAFLALADELKLKGLTGESEKEQDTKGSLPPKSDFQKEDWSQITPTSHRNIHSKSGCPGCPDSAENSNSPQKDCLRTQKLSVSVPES